MAAFALKKSFISKLKNITTVASLRIANLTRVRIAMTSSMQNKARGLLPWYYLPKYNQTFIITFFKRRS